MLHQCGTIRSSKTLPKLKQYREMQHGSPVDTSNVGLHRASQPCCRNSSGILSNNAALEAESNCYIASGMTWLPFSPQLTFIQLPFSPEDPKPNIGRSSAESTHTVILFLQVQSACGTHFLLMSASCCRTASRLNCYSTPWHWCRRLPALFLSTAPHCSLFLSALFALQFGIIASAPCTWTHHRGAILLDLRVGTFHGRRIKKSLVPKHFPVSRLTNVALYSWVTIRTRQTKRRLSAVLSADSSSQ